MARNPALTSPVEISAEAGDGAAKLASMPLHLAAVPAEDQHEGRFQVEGVAVGRRGGHDAVVERFAVGGGGQQQDPQVGHGDARRTDEDVFPGRFEGLGRAPVVDDPRRAERRGFEEDPRHGEVRGEVGSGDGRRQEHHQRRVGADVPQVVAAQVGLRVEVGEARNDAEQHVEERARGVEGEPFGRRRAVEASGEYRRGEGRLHGVEENAREEKLPLAAYGEGRRGDQNACDEVCDHGVSPLRG